MKPARRVKRPARGILALLLPFCHLALLAPAPAATAQEVPADREVFSGRAQVTAVDLVIDVRDEAGRVPTDLTAADFTVLEDGEEKPVVGVELFSRGTAGGSLPAPAAAVKIPPSTVESAWSWSSVVYVDQVLSSSTSIRKATQGLAAQAGRLTSLGTVEIVVADPYPRQVLPATRSARLVEQKLLEVGRTTAGADALRRLRRRYFDDLLLQREMAGRGDGISAGPFDEARPTGTSLGRRNMIWASLLEESDLLLEQQDRMLAWTTHYLGEGPRSLLLVNDGYDLDPRDYYLVGIEDTRTHAEVNSLLQTYSPLGRFSEMTQAIAARGWVCVNLSLTDVGGSLSVAGADVSGKGYTGAITDQFDRNSITALPTSLVLRPRDPMAHLAEETGGELVTAGGKIPEALVRLGQRVRLTYQVARMPDGALHRVEVRSRRPGLTVTAPEWSGSPAPQAVASARARRLLEGNAETGDLPLVAAVAAGDPEAITGRVPGTLQTRIDLTELAAGLPAETSLRVTFAVELEDQLPFVQSDLVEAQALAGLSAWTYTVPISLPEQAGKVSVLVEELSTGSWGGGIAARVSGKEALPDLGEGGHVAAVRRGGGGGRPTAEEQGYDLPVELLPEPKVVVLVPPPGEMVVGRQSFETLVTRADVERVEFQLDGERVELVGGAPYTARIDLGKLPRGRTVEAIAYDAAGKELGRDSVRVNESAGSFRVRLIEPRSPDRQGPVDVEADVLLRDDDELDRVEIAWNDELVATLYAPPFRQQVRVPPESPVGYITVTAHLADGSRAEDVIFMNGPGGDERVDVRLVELFTVVTNQEGRPVLGLGADDFSVAEEGVPQPSVEVRDASELPISLGLLLDTSASMAEALPRVEIAAIDFLYLNLEARDRVALVSFDSQPRLQQPLTSDLAAVARRIADLEAGGYTALCDALAFSLVQMQSVAGRRALVLLSDGTGREERVSYATCLRLAQQVGIPIYAILLTDAEAAEPPADVEKIAAAVGGRVFQVTDLDRLGSVYRTIRDELRGQYLLTYYPASPAPAEEPEWRRVEVSVDPPGLTARTVSGYWP